MNDDFTIELPDLPEIAPESPQSAPPESLALPAGPSPEIATAANRARETHDVELSQLVWTAPTGAQYPLVLTASKWSLFQALSSLVGGEVPQEAVNRQYLDAQIILFLSANDTAVWKAQRYSITYDGGRERPMPLAPLRNDFPAFLNAIEEWTDENVSPDQMGKAVEITDSLITKTWKAQAQGEPSGSGEKKT